MTALDVEVMGSTPDDDCVETTMSVAVELDGVEPLE